MVNKKVKKVAIHSWWYLVAVMLMSSCSVARQNCGLFKCFKKKEKKYSNEMFIHKQITPPKEKKVKAKRNFALGEKADVALGIKDIIQFRGATKVAVKLGKEKQKEERRSSSKGAKGWGSFFQSFRKTKSTSS